jgi:hypothetical protein
MTLVIAGVYLLSVRFEHVYKMHLLNDKIDSIIESKNVSIKNIILKPWLFLYL